MCLQAGFQFVQPLKFCFGDFGRRDFRPEFNHMREIVHGDIQPFVIDPVQFVLQRQFTALQLCEFLIGFVGVEGK